MLLDELWIINDGSLEHRGRVISTSPITTTPEKVDKFIYKKICGLFNIFDLLGSITVGIKSIVKYDFRNGIFQLVEVLLLVIKI
jgi:hypothetical protein